MSSARCCQVHSNSRHNRWPCFSYKYLPISLWDHVKFSINGNIPYFYFDYCQAIRVLQTLYVCGFSNKNIYRIIRTELINHFFKWLGVTYLLSSRNGRKYWFIIYKYWKYVTWFIMKFIFSQHGTKFVRMKVSISKMVSNKIALKCCLTSFIQIINDVRDLRT